MERKDTDPRYPDFFFWTNVGQLPWNPPYALKGSEERLYFPWLCCGTRRPIHPVPLLSWIEKVEDTFVLVDPCEMPVL